MNGVLRRLSTNRQPETAAEDNTHSRLIHRLDGMFGELRSVFRELLQRPAGIVTPGTVRPVLQFGEAALVDSQRGSVLLALPRAKAADAGRVAAFIKRRADNHVSIQTTDGAAINGLYTRIDGMTQMGLHELFWDGSGWWMREPAARVRPHDTRRIPVGLWQFSGATGGTTDLTDSSGNGYTLTVETGTSRPTRLTPHLHGFFFDGSTTLWHNSSVAALRLTGNMTFQCLWALDVGVASAPLVSHLATGETEVTNSLYQFGHGAALNDVDFLSESGLGVNAAATLNTGWAPPGHLCHVGFTRTSGVVQAYLNGRVWGSPSAALTTPTGGADGRLRLGGSATVRCRGSMASAVLIARALTAAQMKEDFHFTLGQAFGFASEYT